MKKITLSIVLSLMVSLFSNTIFASTLHYETAKFKVYGNCEMCKQRIETTLRKNENIKTAVWDIRTKMLTVTYDPHMIGADEIHQLVADAGHDTEKIKATNTAYKNLADCCQYDRAK